MSTDEQKKGDSLRRQLQASVDYARENGLTLIEDFNLTDIGVSAFKGANVATGELGRFLEAVRLGKIPEGSFLLVESHDRLSRQHVNAALEVFLGLLNAGINIVTLADNRVYKARQTDPTDLMYSIMVMVRAHEESLMKSRRIASAWETKRRRAGEKKLTAWCPAWLRLSEDKSSFEILPDRAVVVRRIFDESAMGFGSYTITQRLNKSRTPTFNRSFGWHQSYVERILLNRAVLGEFQPYSSKTGKREPDGPPILGYFPAVVPPDLFDRAQAARAQRGNRSGGRRGKYNSNLFSRLARCGYCQKPLVFIDKGPLPKGRQYLVCHTAYRGGKCVKAPWRYDHFEASFLTFVQELDLATLLTSSTAARERAECEQRIEALKGQLHELERGRDRLIDLAFGEDPISSVKARLHKVEKEILAKEEVLGSLQKTLASRRSEASQLHESAEDIKNLIGRLQAPDSDEDLALRVQVAARLTAMIERVMVYPLGDAPAGISVVEFGVGALSADRNLPSDVAQFIAEYNAGHIGKAFIRRFFMVWLKGGQVKLVTPDRNNPFSLEHDLLSDSVA